MIQLIARISAKESLIGYKFLDTNSNETMVVSISDVIKALKNGNKLIGIKLDSKNQLIGTNGSLSRYPSIDIKHNKVNDDKIVIIINRIVSMYNKHLGYTICNCRGKVKNVKTKDLIDYIVANKTTIANGKLVDNNGYFISTISGEYNTKVVNNSIEYNKENTVESDACIATSPYDTKYNHWDLQDFSEVMSKNRLYFSYNSKEELLEINKKSFYTDEMGRKMFKVPKGVKHLAITGTVKGTIERFIIHSNLLSIRVDKYISINTLILGDCCDIIELNADGLFLVNNLDINSAIKMIDTEINTNTLNLSNDNNLNRISNSFNKFCLKHIKFPKHLMTTIMNSFNKQDLLVSISIIYAERIVESFKNISFNNLDHIMIGDGNKIIDYSFSYIYIDNYKEGNKKINCKWLLPNSTEVIRANIRLEDIERVPENLRIYGCINKIVKFSRDIIVNYDNTASIEKAIELFNCKNLEEVEHLSLPEYDLVISKPKKMELSDLRLNSLNVTNLKAYDLLQVDKLVLERLEFPKDITLLKSNILNKVSGLKLLDLRKYKNLQKIEYDALDNSEIKCVILPDNKDLAYKKYDIYNSTGIENMYLGDRLDTGSVYPINCTYYCKKGSELGENLIAWHRTVIFVESADEVIDKLRLNTKKEVYKKELEKIKIFSENNVNYLMANIDREVLSDKEGKIASNLEYIKYICNKLLAKNVYMIDLDKCNIDSNDKLNNNILFTNYSMFKTSRNIEEYMKKVGHNIEYRPLHSLAKFLVDNLYELKEYKENSKEASLRDLFALKYDSENYVAVARYNNDKIDIQYALYYIVLNGKLSNILVQDIDLDEINAYPEIKKASTGIFKCVVRYQSKTRLYCQLKDMTESNNTVLEENTYIGYNTTRLLEIDDGHNSTNTGSIGVINGIPVTYTMIRFVDNIMQMSILTVGLDTTNNTILVYDINNMRYLSLRIKLVNLNKSTIKEIQDENNSWYLNIGGSLRGWRLIDIIDYEAAKNNENIQKLLNKYKTINKKVLKVI